MARKFLVNLDLNLNQITNQIVESIAGDPGSPTEGRLWYDTVSHTLQFRSNAASIDLGRLDQITAPTAAVALNSQKITGLADPTVGTDAANKQYVDANIAGIDWKGSVRVATTANVTVAGGAPNTVDGVTLALNDRILVKNQTAGAENGIYTVTTLGTGANGTWTRATDADTSAEVTSGMAVPVTEGTAAGDTVWILTTNDPITLATTSLSFSKLGPFTGASKFTATIGDGAATQIDVTHNLGTQDVIVQCRDATSNVVIEPDITQQSTTVTRLNFTTAPASNSVKVVIVG